MFKQDKVFRHILPPPKKMEQKTQLLVIVIFVFFPGPKTSFSTKKMVNSTINLFTNTIRLKLKFGTSIESIFLSRLELNILKFIIEKNAIKKKRIPEMGYRQKKILVYLESARICREVVEDLGLDPLLLGKLLPLPENPSDPSQL